jgi:hypothetical protein
MKILESSYYWCLHICKLTRKHLCNNTCWLSSTKLFSSWQRTTTTIRIYDWVTWEYGSGGKFSFTVCQEMCGIASALHLAIARERVKRHLLISKVSAGNILATATVLAGLG